MKTTGRCLRQTPAETLVLRQLEAATGSLSHEMPILKINSKA
jgi:hypothetical protein